MMKLRSLLVGLVAGALMLQMSSAAAVVTPSDQQLGQVEAINERGLLTYATKQSIKKKWRFKGNKKCRIKRCFGDPEPPPRSNRPTERRPASGGSSPAMRGDRQPKTKAASSAFTHKVTGWISDTLGASKPNSPSGSGPSSPKPSGSKAGSPQATTPPQASPVASEASVSSRRWMDTDDHQQGGDRSEK